MPCESTCAAEMSACLAPAYPFVLIQRAPPLAVLAVRVADNGHSPLMLPLGGGVRLPLDVLHFLGKGRYLQLATITTAWHSLCTRLFPDRKTAGAAMAVSVSLLAWARDSGYQLTWRTAELIAKCGHLE